MNWPRLPDGLVVETECEIALFSIRSSPNEPRVAGSDWLSNHSPKNNTKQHDKNNIKPYPLESTTAQALFNSLDGTE
jgi:hypothetical protein